MKNIKINWNFSNELFFQSEYNCQTETITHIEWMDYDTINARRTHLVHLTLELD